MRWRTTNDQILVLHINLGKKRFWGIQGTGTLWRIKKPKSVLHYKQASCAKYYCKFHTYLMIFFPPWVSGITSETQVTAEVRLSPTIFLKPCSLPICSCLCGLSDAEVKWNKKQYCKTVTFRLCTVNWIEFYHKLFKQHKSGATAILWMIFK